MKKILPLLALLLMACGSTPAHQTTSDASSVEEAAVSHLYYVLNSDSGHVMTASELAHQKSGNGIFKIDLPIDKSNELPLFETIYIDDVTGSRIVFHQEAIEGDTIQPIGTAAECIVWIKPGCKELLITWGYKRSEKTYHAK